MLKFSELYPLSVGGGSTNIAGFEWAEKTADFTAEANKAYYCDTALGNILMTLPSSPTNGDEVAFLFLGVNKLRVTTTSKIKGNLLATDYVKKVAQNYLLFIFEYIDSTTGWSWDTRYDSYITDAYIGLGDPYFNNVELLLQFEGSHGSTNFVDGSSRENTITSTGTITINTSDKKYGNSSLLASGGTLSTPTNSNFGFGTSDFTIEFWLKNAPIIYSNEFYLSMTGSLDGFSIGKYDNSYPIGFFYNGPSFPVRVVANSLDTNNWTHFAVCRQAGNIRVFVNGIAPTYNGTSSGLYDNNKNYGTTGKIEIANVSGKFDAIRVTKGIARYTANFNPETDTYLQF